MRTLSVRLNRLNQIEVTVGELSRAGECYYLGLRPGVHAGELPVASGVRKLLTQWLQQLIQLRDGEQIFLPFDFSDESTRWLFVERRQDEFTLLFGWAAVEGWAINPDDISEYAQGVPGFTPDLPLDPQSFYRPRVISELRHSVAQLSEEPSFSEE
jgi:hypothetical protein